LTEKWSSGPIFILAAIGSAVGIGNIWRFSSVLGENGGGAYLLPYLIAVFLFAVPLMVLELAVGRRLKKDVVSSFSFVRSKFKPLGWIISILLFLLMSYNLVITGWTLAYVIFSISGTEPQFSEFISTYLPIVFFIMAAALSGLVVSLGVKGGIERIVTAVIPLSFIILIALALFATTLDGFSSGLDFLFTPDLSVLSRADIWSAAFGQAFFSLSVGYGILMTYGGYLERNVSIPRSSMIITFADISGAILAGLVIFPIAFTVGLEPTLGAELAFVTLPIAFDSIPYGNILAIAFFTLLFFAALTSAISMLEVNVTVVMEKLGISRKRTAAYLTVGTVAVGMLSALSYSQAELMVGGRRILDLMDETVGSYGLPLAGVLISVVFSWYLDKKEITSEIGERWGGIVIMLTRYVVPVVLIAVTLLSIIQAVFQ